MFRPTQLKVPRDTPPVELRLTELTAGLNRKDFESLIKDNQSPILQNMNSNDRGGLVKRRGWDSLITSFGIPYGTGVYSASDLIPYGPDSYSGGVYSPSFGSAYGTGYYSPTFFIDYPIDGLTYYNNSYVFSSNGKLYKSVGDVAEEILTGLSTTMMRFFEFNSVLYGINGNDFIQYDGTTAQDIQPYIPTTVINRLYSGGGNTFEGLNRLAAGFKNTFNGDGINSSYLLSDTDLDTTEIIITVNSVLLTENINFTVDRVTGIIDFTGGTLPYGIPVSGLNNINVTAYKTYQTSIDSIKQCKYYQTYGGENDTRVFLCGNGNYVFYSGLLDPTYFPFNNYNRLGDPNKECNGFSRLYDILVVFKDTEIYSMTYFAETVSGELLVSFPSKLINSLIGCDCPDSIQIIMDFPVFLNSRKGVHILWSSGNVKEEKNVRLISDNINGALNRTGLLDKTNLTLVSSIDYDQKYWLCVNNEVFLWDYNIEMYSGKFDEGASLSWFYYTNINASCFCENSNNELVFGDRTVGNLKKFGSSYNDDGSSVNAIYRTKLFPFKSGKYELTDYYKSVLQFWLSSRAGSGDQIDIKYYTEKQEIVSEATVSSRETQSFAWNNFSWDNFTWNVANYVVTLNKKPKLKNIQYFQLELSNNEINQNLSIIYLVIQYIITKKIK